MPSHAQFRGQEWTRPGIEKEALKEALEEMLNGIPAFREWAAASKKGKGKAPDGPADAGPSGAGPVASGAGSSGPTDAGTSRDSSGKGEMLMDVVN